MTAQPTDISAPTIAPPTITPLSTDTPSPTVIPTVEPISLQDVDLNKGLLTLDDIAFLDLYEPEEWKYCGSDNNLEEWGIVDKESYTKKVGALLRYPDCTLTISANPPSRFEIDEYILLAENSRQAARIAEGMRTVLENMIGTLCCGYTSDLLSIGDSSIWLIRGNTEREWSYILIVQEEAIIFIDIFGHQKLVQDDLLDLADTAVKKAS